ncbi:MAG: glycosyltransferase, partial [Candidatus Doudnabacteria bacterium]|nr:glycosyltransferase [Candidatus Doudnabacteria bacterium]
QEGKFSKITIGIHQYITKHLPFVWSWLYKSSLVNFLTLPLRVPLASFNYRQAKKIIDEFKPELIICVQTTASAVVAYLKRKKLYNNLFAIGFSDFHLHRYWLYEEADFYLANIQEQKEEMARLGINPNKIFVCGMNARPKLAIDKISVKNKLNAPLEKKVILVGAGSLGIGLNLKMLDDIKNQLDATIIVVCGKNQKLYEELLPFETSKFIVKGFYKPMDELYAIADIFVSKPGGLTTTEALAWKLPMLITHFLPGQEELNINYLASKNLILLPKDNLAGQIKEEINTENFKKHLQNNPNLPILIGDGKNMVEAVNKMLHGV